MKADLEIPISSLAQLRKQLASLAAKEAVSLFLDSHDFPDQYGKHLLLLAMGVSREFEQAAGNGAFAALEEAEASGGWWFGHLAYDLKKETHTLPVDNPAYIAWPDLYWFQPKVVCAVSREQPHVLQVFGSTTLSLPEIKPDSGVIQMPRFSASQDFSAYRNCVDAIRNDIRNGTYYELNHCLEFRGSLEKFDAEQAWRQMSQEAPAPFSAFYRLKGRTALCVSPERFLARRGNLLISEPIKGTAPRNANPIMDETIKKRLAKEEKNRAENVMIVDLVRNDLSRGCIPGTVKVPELCAIRSYAQVHQMTSVVCGQSLPGVGMAEHLKNTFPMGSMTGAPKHEVMQHIERYESFRRGLYSGAIGYMEPTGDADFNVVIRTLQYEAHSGRMAYHTGGAITWDSNAVQEWDECSWKARSVFKAFGDSET
jgi:para-aminobenzoate synthetase component 1